MKKEVFQNMELKRDSNEPLFVQFANSLRRVILQGKLEVGMQLPPIKQLAEIAGVSIFTIDRGLGVLLKEGFLARRPKKGTYVSGRPTAPQNGQKRGLAARRRIIFCSGKLEADEYMDGSNFYGLIFQGMQVAAHQASVALETSTFQQLPETLEYYNEHSDVALLGVACVSEPDNGEVSQIAKHFPNVRFVLANHLISDFELTPPNLKGVFSDDFGGAYELTIRALDHEGRHSQVAIFSRHLREENYRERVRGITQALREHGLGGHVVFEDESEDANDVLGGLYMKRLIQMGEPYPTLVIAVNDFLVSGAMAYLNRLHPDLRFSFCGYDGLLSAALPFPTVQVNFTGIGKRAIEVILHNDFEHMPKLVMLPARQISRHALTAFH